MSKWINRAVRLTQDDITAQTAPAKETIPATRLQSMAAIYRLDPDELSDWFRNDLDMIRGMDDSTIDALVRDYAANRDIFRNQKPFMPYRLWLYKFNAGDPGYVRQGLMTNDKTAAATMLQRNYGQPVHDLHLQEKQKCS